MNFQQINTVQPGDVTTIVAIVVFAVFVTVLVFRWWMTDHSDSL